MYYQNVRGLRTKLDDIFLASIDCNYDVIILTETGLDDSINSLQVFSTSFNVYRCDRSPLNSDKRSFGGVLIAVAERHCSSRIVACHGSRLEQVCVAANIGGTRFRFCAIYVPPDKSRNADLMDEHISTVRELCENASDDDIVFVCGDYNQPRIAWCIDENGIRPDNSSSVTPAGTALLDGMDFLNLFQANVQLNSLGRTLDLIFAPIHSRILVHAAEDPLLPVDFHHPPLSVRCDVSGNKQQTTLQEANRFDQKLNYRKIDFDLLLAHLFGLEWSFIYDSEDVNDMAAKFSDAICDWLSANVPMKRKPAVPPWNTPQLKKLKRSRRRWHRYLRIHHSTFARLNFKHASDNYRRLNAALYKSHVLRVQNNLRREPKSFWSYVNSKRKNTSVTPNVVYEDSESTSESEACDLFAIGRCGSEYF
ncbi:uncharacterized protein LOC134203396 [Armigeres subalbatus]|uniref:uncharacterized protein LOC134203396 n=1 Tax=Armigeres subalbatus TaxID=124917 RepID=UPI002ED31999